MEQVNWDTFKPFEPCYDPQERYGDWSGTIIDLLKRDDIPANDRIWASTRKGILSDKQLRLFAVACAKSVQHLMTDKRSIDAIEVAERYVYGNATDEELAASRAAARAAAWDAAWAAAGDAASAAARAAAWAAAGAASRAAASAAAWDAASAAAWDAARAAARAAASAAAWDAQIKMLIEIIETN